ncbi:MAG: hypothetical protein Q9182_002107 [Xanthomendoza sp. 2 TL-2023]
MASLVFGNGTNLVSWKPSPTSRCTFDLLSTCITTLVLCVWTAVHLNVYPPGSFWSPVVRKFKWLMLALFAPEVLVYTAWSQRQQALEIMRYVNDAYGLEQPSFWYRKPYSHVAAVVGRLARLFRPHQRVHGQPALEFQEHASLEAGEAPTRTIRRPWTLSHGFYAIMGGFATDDIPRDLPSSGSSVPPASIGFRFVTPVALQTIINASPEEIPDLSLTEIKSKGKADSFTKALTCGQALWFIAQCFTRIAQHKPITLLELNTFGHAVCALLIYLLWWNKPFGVDYPTSLEGRSLQKLRALVFMLENEQLGPCWPLKFALDKVLEVNSEPHHDGNFTSRQIQRLRGILRVNWNETILHLKPMLPKFCKFVLESIDPIQLSQDQREKYDNLCHELRHFEILATDVTRWRMALDILEAVPDEKLDDKIWKELLVRKCDDWPNLNVFKDIGGIACFTMVALVYGGFHAMAWSKPFHSSIEQLLWRISVCAVMGAFPVFAASMGIYNWFVTKAERGELLGLYMEVLLEPSVLLLTGSLYVLARMYLVGECFYSLSHLPAGVYDVPRWITFFPHFG